MPHVIVKLWPGKSEQQKTRLAEAITKDVMDILHYGEELSRFAAPIYAGYRKAIPVPADAPPLFIALTDDDKLVAPISGARLYEAWHAAGKPAELHVFVKGEHGFGMKKQNLPSDAWIDLFKTWLGNLGYLSPTANNSPGSRRYE
jgi:acetyl esterase/lipase